MDRVSILFFPTVDSFIGLLLCPERLTASGFKVRLIYFPLGEYEWTSKLHHRNHVKVHMVCKAYLQFCTIVTIFFCVSLSSTTNFPTLIHVNESKLQWFMGSVLDTNQFAELIRLNTTQRLHQQTSQWIFLLSSFAHQLLHFFLFGSFSQIKPTRMMPCSLSVSISSVWLIWILLSRAQCTELSIFLPQIVTIKLETLNQ